MPAGVDVVVEDGFATIDFVDKTKRGPGLAKLFEIGTPPEAVEKLTRSGPRAVYVVPEGNARAAGLLDEVGGASVPVLIDGAAVQDAILGAVEIPDGGVVPVTVIAEGGANTDSIGNPDSVPVLAPVGWPEGEPDDDWTRPELDAYAQAVKGIDTREFKNKAAVLDAIRKPVQP